MLLVTRQTKSCSHATAYITRGRRRQRVRVASLNTVFHRTVSIALASRSYPLICELRRQTSLFACPTCSASKCRPLPTKDTLKRVRVILRNTFFRDNTACTTLSLFPEATVVQMSSRTTMSVSCRSRSVEMCCGADNTDGELTAARTASGIDQDAREAQACSTVTRSPHAATRSHKFSQAT